MTVATRAPTEADQFAAFAADHAQRQAAYEASRAAYRALNPHRTKDQLVEAEEQLQQESRP